MPREARPKRRRGGQELPDDVQNRPEQNAGYDEAVQDPTGMPEPATDMDVDEIGGDGGRMMHIDAPGTTGRKRPDR